VKPMTGGEQTRLAGDRCTVSKDGIPSVRPAAREEVHNGDTGWTARREDVRSIPTAPRTSCSMDRVREVQIVDGGAWLHDREPWPDFRHCSGHVGQRREGSFAEVVEKVGEDGSRERRWAPGLSLRRFKPGRRSG